MIYLQIVYLDFEAIIAHFKIHLIVAFEKQLLSFVSFRVSLFLVNFELFFGKEYS